MVRRPSFGQVHLTREAWANIPDTHATWHAYNAERDTRCQRDRVVGRIVAIIIDIVSAHLTHRQRQAFLLYFCEQKTQVEIARRLGISQPTVSQHLMGKRRLGKKIGGALRRIRKAIRKCAAEEEGDGEATLFIMIIDGLLDDGVSRRTAALLLQSLAPHVSEPE